MHVLARLILVVAAVAVLYRLWEWMIARPSIVVALVAGSAVLALVKWSWRRYQGTRLSSRARMITVLLPPTIVDPAGGSVLWSNLIGLLRPAWRRLLVGQPHVTYEYVFSEQGVEIRLWVPKVVPPGLLERAVEAAWPGAHTRTTPAEPSIPPPPVGMQSLIAGGVLRLARPEALPIRTVFDTDPIRTVIGAAVGLGPGEYACVQILTRPVTGHRVSRVRRTARRLRNGRSTYWVVQLLRVVFGLGPTRSKTAQSRQIHEDPLTVLGSSVEMRAIAQKERAGHYETVIRYASVVHLPADTSRDERRSAQGTVRGRAHALAAAFAGFTEHNYYRRRRLHRAERVLAARRLGRGDLLSVPELAALAHLPTGENIPGVQRAAARAVPPPPAIALPGPAAKPLGVADSGVHRQVALRVPDARYHLHLVGATGTGKSTLLANILLADIDAGRGIVLIDPKGDLVTDILARLPSSAADRVVLFDPEQRSRPPCLNPLDGGDTALTVDNLVSVFRRVYSAFWGPRTDDVMRAACLTLRAHHAVATLADLPKILIEPAYRARITAGISDPVLRGFWAWYDELSDAQRSQVIAPLLNKLRAFLLRPFVRDAIASGPSTVDMTQVLDGGICLVRIPKGTLGDETTRLMGSLIVASTWQAATGRARQPEEQRRDASMAIDECHNFLNLPYPIEDMLAEARSYRLAFTLAHQHLSQLPRELREGISTNARNKIFFTVGPDDARDLARHTTPRLSEHDLAHLDRYHAAARLMLHGGSADPFTLTTSPLPPAKPRRTNRKLRATDRPATTSRSHTRPTPHPGADRPDQVRRVTDPRRHA